MTTLRYPSQYVKAIVALVVSIVGALITAGLLTGKTAVAAGAIVTGLTAFGTVFAMPNKANDTASVSLPTPERIDPSA